MHDTRPARAADGRDRRRVRQRRRGQRRTRVAGTRMHDHPCGLVDDEHIVVLVDDAQRDRLGTELVGGARRNLDVDARAALQPVRTLARHAIDAHAAHVDQRLQARARDIGDVRREPSIEPLARLGGVDRQGRCLHRVSGAAAGRRSSRSARSVTPTVIDESATLNAGQ